MFILKKRCEVVCARLWALRNTGVQRFGGGGVVTDSGGVVVNYEKCIGFSYKRLGMLMGLCC
jgi:hypothetical protein